MSLLTPTQSFPVRLSPLQLMPRPLQKRQRHFRPAPQLDLKCLIGLMIEACCFGKFGSIESHPRTHDPAESWCKHCLEKTNGGRMWPQVWMLSNYLSEDYRWTLVSNPYFQCVQMFLALLQAARVYRADPGARHIRLFAVVSSPFTMITSVTVMHCKVCPLGEATLSFRAITVDVPETLSRVFDVQVALEPT